MKVFINPGHAPDRYVDPGAINIKRGLYESEVVAKIGTRVMRYLSEVGYEVLMYQHESLEQICRRANEWCADAFVSIHCNAFDGKARGTESYYSRYSDAGHRLAEMINRQLASSMPLGGYTRWDRGVKPAGFYVLMNTDMPSALVETAFIDNENDADLLVLCEDIFARAIARGVSDFFA